MLQHVPADLAVFSEGVECFHLGVDECVVVESKIHILPVLSVKMSDLFPYQKPPFHG